MKRDGVVSERVRAVGELHGEPALGVRPPVSCSRVTWSADRLDAVHAAIGVAVPAEHHDIAVVDVRRERVVQREVEVRDDLDPCEPQQDRDEREPACRAPTCHPA